MSELHDVLNASLAVNQQLAAEVDALKKYAKSMPKKVTKTASTAPKFSKEALEKAADVLVDSGFLKSASKQAYIDMIASNPDKVLESLQKIAANAVKPVDKPEQVGSVVQKNASWFSVKEAKQEDPYKDCFQRY